MSAPDIVCLGEPLIEFIREGGPESTTYRRGIGGDTLNAACAAARQGASVGYVTALGADRFGDVLLDFARSEGIDTTAIARSRAASTGLNIIEPHPEGRFFTYYRAGSAASQMTAGAVDMGYITRAKVLHLSGITLAVSSALRATAFAAMRAAQGAGVVVSVDTNLRLALWTADEARTVTDEAMIHARIAVTSIDDSKTLTGLDDPDRIIARYQAMGPTIVIVTMGADGALIGDGPARHRIAPGSAVPVDSTGAGDSFSGAFLAYWLETGDVAEAGARAARVAAGTVSGLGAIDPIPMRRDVMGARA